MATAPKLTTDTSAAALSAALAAPAVEKDEFGDAFAGFADPQPETKTETTATTTEAVQDGKEAGGEGDEPGTEIEAPAEGAEGGEEGEAETPEAKAAREAAEAEAAKKDTAPKPVTADDIARLADALRTQPEPKPAQTTQAAEPAPLYTAEEVSQLQNFYKEWPEVAPAVATLLKGAITATENRIYAEVARVLGPKLKLIDQLADNAVYSQIKQAVPDYDETLEAKVSAWVKTQPAYLQAAYTSVMQNGTADDITDLVNRFRQETGSAAPSGDRTTQTMPSPSPAKQAAPLSTAAKKAAAALAPVTSKRTGNTQVEPQTFDDAFDVFAKAG